jgi:hypothetical protein
VASKGWLAGWPGPPQGVTDSIPVHTIVHLLSAADRAVVADVCPRQMFLLSVPGGTLELLRHTPGVNGEGQGSCAGLLWRHSGHCLGRPPARRSPLPPTLMTMHSYLMVAVARFGRGGRGCRERVGVVGR